MFVQAVSGLDPSVLDALNDEQRLAVTHEGGPLLVLAGAGTGKTTTLCTRTAWLVGQGLAPERVLLLTFTRRAAREMLARTRTLLSPDIAGSVVGGTFHSTAHRVIRAHAATLGLPPNFRVLDTSDAADVLDLLREERGLAGQKTRFPRKGTLLDVYSRCVNAQQSLSRVLSESFPWCEAHGDEMAGLFRLYGERKRELAVLDLDDLLLYWHALACHEVVGAQLGAMFEHILVDEYQDLNALQVEIVRGLRRQHGGLTAVGDDAQAIYGFRAASAEHILDFKDHFPDATVVTLERNYRSSQPILDLANVVASGATRAYPKRLRADREGGTLPKLRYCRDEAQQAQNVCADVLEFYEQGTALMEQAVLMRAGRHSAQLELELTRRRIPFVKYGGINYLDAAHVKDFTCALRLADNPGDTLAWFRILQLLEGVGPVTARRVLDQIDPGSVETIAAVEKRWETVLPLLKEPARQAAAPLIAALAACTSDKTVGTTVERLHKALVPVIRAHYPDGPARVGDLDQLTAAAAHASSLSGFLSDLALDPPSSSADYAKPPQLDEDYLTLSTVHSAKGLEWNAVHLIAASDGNFPSDMALTTSEGLEEERRLFYVALTRARHSLTIYVPLRYYHQPHARTDTHGYGNQSRFLTDQAEALCDRIDTASSEHDWAQSGIPETVTVDLANLWR
ncbi:MAG: ATP-dependent helicase [Gaiellaceae bacterium]